MSRDDARSFGFDTRMVHAGHVPDALTGARAVPIHQTTSFVFDDAQHAAELFELKQYGHIYTRISNPTTSVFEERLASLEGATGAVATASGMAAQLVTFMTLLQPGDEVVASTQLYGGSLTQMVHTLRKLSITVRFADPGKHRRSGNRRSRRARAPSTARRSATRAAPSSISTGWPRSPTATASRSSSTTRWRRRRSAGRSSTARRWSSTRRPSSSAGTAPRSAAPCSTRDASTSRTIPSIAAPSPAYHDLRFYDTFGHYGFLTKARAETVRDTGACLSPFNAFLLLQGLETLSLRMERQTASALRIARFLEQHPAVTWVAYAGLPSHPDHALAQKYLPEGAGAVLSFGLRASAGDVRAAGRRFIEGLGLFSHLANIGDVRSLVIHPASTTHQQLSDAELERAGVAPELIRLSIGLETVEDLEWDLDQALRAPSR